MAAGVVCEPHKLRGAGVGITGVLGLTPEELGWGVHELVALLLSRNLLAEHDGKVF